MGCFSVIILFTLNYFVFVVFSGVPAVVLDTPWSCKFLSYQIEQHVCISGNEQLEFINVQLFSFPVLILLSWRHLPRIIICLKNYLVQFHSWGSDDGIEEVKRYEYYWGQCQTQSRNLAVPWVDVILIICQRGVFDNGENKESLEYAKIRPVINCRFELEMHQTQTDLPGWFPV